MCGSTTPFLQRLSLSVFYLVTDFLCIYSLQYCLFNSRHTGNKLCNLFDADNRMMVDYRICHYCELISSADFTFSDTVDRALEMVFGLYKFCFSSPQNFLLGLTNGEHRKISLLNKKQVIMCNI